MGMDGIRKCRRPIPVGKWIREHKKRSAVLLTLLFLAVAYYFCLPRQLFTAPLSAVLESSEGKLLGARIARDGQWRFPAGDSVPVKFRKALVRYEDKRFYYHPGVDPLAAARALWLNVKYGKVVSGGSTLSMQVIRLSRGNRKRTLSEKMIEALLATRLECRYSKEEILHLYASNAPFGGNVVGLEAASRRFFNTSPSELTWAECAMLAVLPNAPSLVHIGNNRTLLLEKRNRLLRELRDAGDISEPDYSLAIEEPLPPKPFPMPDYAYHYLERKRKESGDGFIPSGIDYYLQQRVNALVREYHHSFRGNNVNNLAVIVLDVDTGLPLAYAGNVPAPGGVPGAAVDVVTAPRSSGSTLKPLLYAAMLQSGEILPGQLVKDIPHRYKNFSPQNYNKEYEGAVPAREVIRRSLNVPSVRMLDDYGVERFLGLLRELGFSTVDKSAEHYGLSLILGGAEITLDDLAGVYRRLALLLNEFSEDKKNRRSGDTAADVPLSAASVWLTFEALSEVNRPEEEGDWKSFASARKVAWKTGTSWGNRDAWSVGVTPRYVVGVWVGNCSGEGRPGLTGVSYAAPLMFDVFSLLPPTGWFAMPEKEMEQIAVCSRSGHPASSACDRRDTIWVPVTDIRPPECPYHRTIHLDPTGSWIVNSSCCEPSRMQTVSWFVLPPAQEWYYMQNHLDYRKLPPLHPGMRNDLSGSGGGIEILYPQNGSTVVTPLALDSKSRGAVFRAFCRDKEAMVFWHLDDRYIGATFYPEHRMTVVPSRGNHVLKLIDETGNQASVRFRAE